MDLLYHPRIHSYLVDVDNYFLVVLHHSLAADSRKAVVVDIDCTGQVAMAVNVAVVDCSRAETEESQRARMPY